ncbi:hypothetical protein MPLDJ20_60027 [Mesorhizobium plurifarium]|uniref:Uncharacterized protein n=1 Tax=Mesorhizobium plurifarium TaxID=69974 RepID=A0A090FMN3_MESPL|nr:hypothetical protein MPLDJ20_60027 [Mesorhizobium plurifarium]
MVKGQSPVRRIGLQEVRYDFGVREAYNLMQVGVFSKASAGSGTQAAVGPVQFLDVLNCPDHSAFTQVRDGTAPPTFPRLRYCGGPKMPIRAFLATASALP